MTAELKRFEMPPTNWLNLADRVAAEIGPRAAQHDADDSFVAECYARLKADGVSRPPPAPIPFACRP